MIGFHKSLSLGGAVLLVCIPCALSQRPSPRRGGRQIRVDEPVFGISYDPTHVHYEQIPSWVDKACQLGGGDSIYAHMSRKDSEYFIVMSYDPAQEGDSFGNSIWVKAGKCQMDESKWTLSGIPPPGGYRTAELTEGLPGLDAPKVCESRPREDFCRYVLRSAAEEAVLRSLVEDGIERAVRAFGKAQFKKKACSSETLSEQSDYPIVDQELRRFCAAN